jgi:hypothetical protein
VSDREGFDAVEWKWYRALASDARLGTARSAGGGDRLRDLCAKNAEGNRPPAGFFCAGDDSEVGSPDGRAASSGTGDAPESRRGLGRSWCFFDRVERANAWLGVLAGGDLASARAFSIAGIGRGRPHKCASKEKVATLSRM